MPFKEKALPNLSFYTIQFLCHPPETYVCVHNSGILLWNTGGVSRLFGLNEEKTIHAFESMKVCGKLSKKHFKLAHNFSSLCLLLGEKTIHVSSIHDVEGTMWHTVGVADMHEACLHVSSACSLRSGIQTDDRNNCDTTQLEELPCMIFRNWGAGEETALAHQLCKMLHVTATNLVATKLAKTWLSWASY